MDRVRVNEQSVKAVTFTITDENSDPVASASLDAAELTLYDVDTYVGGSPATGIINDRQAQDVLNTNDVTVGATDGLVTWLMQPEDNVIVTELRQVERHRAAFRFAWDTGSFEYEFEIEVTNLRSQG